MKDYLSFINESTYDINLNTGDTNYNYIGKNRGRFNRLKHLVYQIEQSGSPLQGEKVAEILLGSVNLNTLDLSYPFVDLKVVSPVKNITINNELISVKTSRDMHKLEDAISYVNGFKIQQLIQFAISKINLNLYKNKTFKKRFALKTSSITSYFQKEISKYNNEYYTFAFMSSIIIFKFIKEVLEKLRKKDNIIEDRRKLYNIISMCIASFIDKKFNTNFFNDAKYTSDDTIDVVKSTLESFSVENEDYGEYLPDELKNIKISYCILYFSKPGEDLILNLQKTQAVNFNELFNKSMEIWHKKGYISKDKQDQNLYLKYNDVFDAFSGNGLTGKDVFNTHIKVIINADYEERSETIKKLYVKVIDNIKGIENDDQQKRILKLLNKYLNKINTSNNDRRDYYIQKFSDIFNK